MINRIVFNASNVGWLSNITFVKGYVNLIIEIKNNMQYRLRKKTMEESIYAQRLFYTFQWKVVVLPFLVQQVQDLKEQFALLLPALGQVRFQAIAKYVGAYIGYGALEAEKWKLND